MVTEKRPAFGDLLRMHRLAAGLTQEGLAERAGLSARGLSDLERGARRLPHPVTVQRLANALRLSDAERAIFQAAPGRPTPAETGGRQARRRPMLPAPLTSFVGREREIVEIAQLLATGRLVTLTGPGGCGKTRLALEAAFRVDTRFHDGSCFVSLASLRSSQDAHSLELVASAIAQVLQIREVTRQSMVETLKRRLREARLLLVLDNFEHLLHEAPLVSELLITCPGLAVLATSRQLLHLQGERVYSVPPLVLPDGPRRLSIDELACVEAIQLFVERARAAFPDFALTEENREAVTEICRHLDGLPLGIELAAARIRHLSASALLARLERRLPLLTGGARDLPARQQALRDAVAWSYDLLGPEERALFRHLAVFVGGWTLKAANAVCAAEGEPGIDLLDSMTALVDKSLVVRVAPAEAEPRFTMLETIREYALERLEASDDACTTHRRHFQYFLSVAEATQAEMWGLEQAAWLRRIEADHANFRAALHWASGHDAPGGLRLGVALWRFWWVRGHAGEGLHWLESLLSGIPVDTAAAETGSYLDGLSLFRARARQQAGLLARSLGDYDRATALLEQSLADFRVLGDDGGAAVCLGHLAWMAGDRDDRQRAATLLQDGFVLAQSAAIDEHDRTFALQWLGLAARDVGDNERAMALFEESLGLSRRLGDRWSIAQNLQWLGSVAWRRGDHRRATELLTESLDQQQALGDRPGAAWSLHLLGGLIFDQGDAERAARKHLESLAIHRDTGEQTGISAALRGLGRVAHARGDASSAVRLFGAARVHEVSSPAASSPTMAGEDDDLSDLRKSLGDKSFELAWAEGRAMTLEQAVAYALDEEPSA